MIKKEEIPCVFYFHLHLKFLKKFENREVDIKELKSYLGRWGIKRNIKPLIIRELELLKLIEKVDKRKFIMVGKPLNQKKINEFYNKLLFNHS